MTHHLAHLLMLVVPFSAFAVLFAVEWRRTAEQSLGAPLVAAAVGSAAAGLVHAVVVPHHEHESAVLGWFFALLAVGQLAWVVVLLLRPRRGLVGLALATNLGVVLLWAWTRAVGVPFGLHGRGPEAVGALDLAATAAEVVVVIAAAWVLSPAYGATGELPWSPAPLSKCDRSTTRNSPPPRNTSSPELSLPSQDRKSFRPSRRSTLATRS